MYNLIVNTKLFPPTFIRCEYACIILSAFKRRFDASSMLPRLGISYNSGLNQPQFCAFLSFILI